MNIWNEKRCRAFITWAGIASAGLGIIYAIPDRHRHVLDESHDSLPTSATQRSDGLFLNGERIDYRHVKTLDLDAMLEKGMNALTFARSARFPADALEIEYRDGGVRRYDFRGETDQDYEQIFGNMRIYRVTIIEPEATFEVRDDG